MDANQRLARALQIRQALWDLMTTEESDTYECLSDHLEDYIRDLGIDAGAELPTL
jgi:ribulose bisphosphate carboxylase small subunit